MREFGFFVFAAALAIVTIACSDQTEEDKAKIKFLLTDMPGVYQEVNIDIAAVHVIVDDSLVELTTNRGIYNLLEFVNGKDTLLVDDAVPAGLISQIRLVLGENNTVMVDGVLHDLKTPSAQQSGLKLNIHNVFQSGESYVYVLDFVVEKSIVVTGNGKYNLKPVIRVFTEAITGSIQGVVDPPEARPLISAMSEADTASALADAVGGEFIIRGLPGNNYALKFEPVEGYKDTVLNDITVIPGQIMTLDTMFIE